jgi:hypothetical protein
MFEYSGRSGAEWVVRAETWGQIVKTVDGVVTVDPESPDAETLRSCRRP